MAGERVVSDILDGTKAPLAGQKLRAKGENKVLSGDSGAANGAGRTGERGFAAIVNLLQWPLPQLRICPGWGREAGSPERNAKAVL